MEIQPDDILMVVVTTSNMEEARRISEGVVASRLAACATTIPAVQSIYRWQGKIANEQESMLVLKTTKARLSALEQAIHRMHSYEVPEILAFPITAGSSDYLNWVRKETSESLSDKGQS